MKVMVRARWVQEFSDPMGSSESTKTCTPVGLEIQADPVWSGHALLLVRNIDLLEFVIWRDRYFVAIQFLIFYIELILKVQTVSHMKFE